MRTVKFFMLAAILGWSFSTTQVVGNDTGLAQTPTDSIIMCKLRMYDQNQVKEVGDSWFAFMSSNKDDVVSLKIYNRFGTLVFSTEGKICSWNGRSSNDQKLDDGIYVFRAEVIDASPEIVRIGSISLLDKEE